MREALCLSPPLHRGGVEMIEESRIVKGLAMLVLLASLSLICPAATERLPVAHAEDEEYVCPPCGCNKDGTVFSKPGGCPECGMRLVLKSSLANQQASQVAAQTPRPPRQKVAILIFNGVQIIDYSGPYEVFGQAGFEVYTVAASPDMITTTMGLKVTPSYTFADVPKPDILIIPGGG